MSFPVTWTAHLQNNPKDKKDFEDQLAHSNNVLARLKTIIEDKEKSIDRAEFSVSSYESPGWSHKQAYLNGRRAELAELKQLLPT